MEGSEAYVVGELWEQEVQRRAQGGDPVVALSVLAERGYGGASMREIAGRAQASKETLYAWFGDKRGLFEELVRWQAERVERRARAEPRTRRRGCLGSFARLRGRVAAAAARGSGRGHKPGRHLRGDHGPYVRAGPGRPGEGQRRPEAGALPRRAAGARVASSSRRRGARWTPS